MENPPQGMKKSTPSDQQKKLYKKPELIVLGGAEVTNNNRGIDGDGGLFSDNGAS